MSGKSGSKFRGRPSNSNTNAERPQEPPETKVVALEYLVNYIGRKIEEKKTTQTINTALTMTYALLTFQAQARKDFLGRGV